ncbi:uncharacterized protein LOC123871092 [Maniola jurtina]|uniref:uncharacterized protein LOC123871092 n=1 Tax=Maniola jurtina TaxID=191418 RepID=UPI001E68D46F|nr:uncharacterized protein LOC123871092 [Maniola jurtina]
MKIQNSESHATSQCGRVGRSVNMRQLSSFVVLLFGLNLAAATQAPCIELNDGNKMPIVALGTGRGTASENAPLNEVRQAVYWAIEAGYRHIDTAAIYFDETEVGQGIQDAINNNLVTRDQLFVTTKLWSDKHRQQQVVPALKESLQKLGLDYVDLYLIHFPIAVKEDGSFDDVDYLETWRGMEEARALGLTRSIGVSNFNASQVDRIITNSRVWPAVNQVEVNPTLTQEALVTHCQELGVAVMAFSPFGFVVSRKRPDAPPPRADDPVLVQMANKYKKSVGQIVLRYLIDRGLVPIPKSVNKKRLAENIDLFDFSLTKEEVQLINRFNKNKRSLTHTIVVPISLMNDGHLMPRTAFGTYMLDDRPYMRQAVTWAIEAGYRHIDTAALYTSEDKIGEAIYDLIKQGIVKRSELFITSKLSFKFGTRGQVIPAIRDSLKRLKTDYVDLYLIHIPRNVLNVTNYDYLEIWKGLEDAKRMGLTRSIGVSNFNSTEINKILLNSKTPPAVSQIEINPTFTNLELVAYCQSKGITVSGYAPLGFLVPRSFNVQSIPPTFDDPILVRMAKKYGVAVNQIVLRYLVDRNVMPIVASLDKDHIESNIDIFNFTIRPEDILLINEYNRNFKVYVIDYDGLDKAMTDGYEYIKDYVREHNLKQFEKLFL